METYAKELIRHVSQDELKKFVHKEKDIYVHDRLLFINQLYLGDGVAKACERMCISVQTGYNWLELWNRHGYEGLDPNFGGGRPPNMTDKEKEELKDKLKDKLKSKDSWLTQEVRALIRKDFSITYSFRHVVRILREFGMNYSKPYIHRQA